MNRCYEPTWSRKLLLLSALVAGAVATQFVPPYRELAFMPKDEAVTAPRLSVSKSRDMTGADVNTHRLEFIRSIG
jgi:hypothetical protein